MSELVDEFVHGGDPAFSNDGKFVVTVPQTENPDPGAVENYVLVYDILNDELVDVTRQLGGPRSLPDLISIGASTAMAGDHLAAFKVEDDLVLFDLASRTVVSRESMSTLTHSDPEAPNWWSTYPIAISPNGRHLLMTTSLVDLDTGDVTPLPDIGEYLGYGAVADDGSAALRVDQSGSVNGHARVWARDGDADATPVPADTFAPQLTADGRYVVAFAAPEGQYGARLYDRESGDHLTASFPGHFLYDLQSWDAVGNSGLAGAYNESTGAYGVAVLPASAFS